MKRQLFSKPYFQKQQYLFPLLLFLSSVLNVISSSVIQENTHIQLLDTQFRKRLKLLIFHSYNER